MKLYYFFIFTLLMLSCKTPPWNPEKTHIAPISRTYYNISQAVLWEKILESLADFDIERSSMNEGIIITEWKEEQLQDHFVLYADRKMPMMGRYRITIFLEQLDKGINVKILKEHLVEAFSEAVWKPINSDHLLEKSIHYRITHLISIYKYFEHLKNQKTPAGDFYDCPDDDDDGICDKEEELRPTKKKKTVKNIKRRDKTKKEKSVESPKKRKKGFFESSFFSDFSD